MMTTFKIKKLKWFVFPKLKTHTVNLLLHNIIIISVVLPEILQSMKIRNERQDAVIVHVNLLLEYAAHFFICIEIQILCH